MADGEIEWLALDTRLCDYFFLNSKLDEAASPEWDKRKNGGGGKFRMIWTPRAKYHLERIIRDLESEGKDIIPTNILPRFKIYYSEIRREQLSSRLQQRKRELKMREMEKALETGLRGETKGLRP